MKRIFWQDVEGRPRSGWRLLGQLVIMVVLLVLMVLLFTALFGPLLLQIGLATETGSLAVVFFGVVVSVWLAGRFLDHRPFADFGFQVNGGWCLDLGFGLALAALLMTAIFLVEWAAGWLTVVGAFRAAVPGQSFASAILVPFVLFVMVGIQEELLVRGYQLHNLAEGFNLPSVGPRMALVGAWLVSSIVFGFLHSTNPNATPLSTFNLVLAGLFLGLGYVLTSQLAIPIGLHIAWNFVQGNVFGFPVSGARINETTFFEVRQQGPDLWTGGAFGPEGGLLVLPVLLVGSAVTLLWVRYRYGGIELAMSLPAPPVRRPKRGRDDEQGAGDPRDDFDLPVV